MRVATPIISVVAICIIVASVISHNAEKILSTSTVIFAVVILHNLLGFFFGFLVAALMGLPIAKIKTLTIEIGMQNSGLASVLANDVFADAPLAATPGAIFSVWHNLSGAILAEFFKRWNAKDAKRDLPVAEIKAKDESRDA